VPSKSKSKSKPTKNKGQFSSTHRPKTRPIPNSRSTAALRRHLPRESSLVKLPLENSTPELESCLPQEQIFVRAWIASGFKGKDAALEAGYKARWAAVASSRLLALDRVQLAIASLLSIQSAKYARQADAVLQELDKDAFSNMANYIDLDQNGAPYVNLANCTKDQFGRIKKVSSEVIEREPTKVDKETGEVVRPGFLVRKTTLELKDSQKAAELLGRHFKLWGDDKIPGGGAANFLVPIVNVTFQTPGDSGQSPAPVPASPVPTIDVKFLEGETK